MATKESIEVKIHGEVEEWDRLTAWSLWHKMKVLIQRLTKPYQNLRP